jgi:acyl-CoA reductase-like NAD-dependent aldehyde dehydrogenase
MEQLKQMNAFKQYINGEWTDAANGGTWDLVNPATEGVIQQVPFGDAEDVIAAVDAAQLAFPGWASKSPFERSKYLVKAAAFIAEHAEEWAAITTEESGKPKRESLAEWRSSTNYLQYYAEEGKRLYGRIVPTMNTARRIFVTRQPLGVIGTITAWNFPVYNVVRSVGAILAAGCTVVTRPSEYTPRTAMLVAAAFEAAGLPKGVFNVVNGEPEAMGAAMLSDPRVRKIHFTGSTRVGKLLMDGASQTVTGLSLEMGGNAPVIVMPDTDVDTAARRSALWKYRNAGQVCVSPQRFYVHSQIAEQFVDTVVEETKRVVLGNGLDDKTDVGPLINARQRDRVECLVKQSDAMGAEVLVGGSRPAGLDAGYFYNPTVLANVTDDMPVYTEELFGPVMPIITFDDSADAICMANDTDYGLAAFVLTNDLYTAIEMSEKLEYGMVSINDWLPATPEAPFVGFKQSGIGAESGPEGVAEYTETKVTYIGGVR